jgi:GDP-4-dehydro-6-deoxy-D-mannose reductase
VGTSQLPVDSTELNATVTSARDDLRPVTLADVEWRVGDLREPGVIEGMVADVQPAVIIHLAAMSFVPQAARQPALAVELNVGTTVRVLHAAATLRTSGVVDPTVLVVGSAEQYGRHAVESLPLAETAEQVPLTVYGATKVAAEVFARQFARSTGVRVVIARPFNHTGPGQEPRFLLPALVARALDVRDSNGAAPFPIGNRDTVRDILHVRDVVAAYIALVRYGRAGEAYNVCSGRGWSTGDLAHRVLQRAGVQATLTQDPALTRPAEVPALIGDATRLRTTTGWVDRFSLDDLLDDLLDASAR